MLVHALRVVLLALYTAFWASLACVVGLLDRSGEAIVWMARRWVRWVAATSGVRIEALGLENVRPGQPYVFMSNHQSLFDVVAIVDTIPVSFRFVAKKELTWIPFFGWALRIGGHVIVDRSRRERAVASLRRAAEQIRSGTNVIIFPEGTRSETGEMRDFKSGGFHLAIQAGVPILPVSISGSRDVVRKKSLRIDGGSIRVIYGKPIPTATLAVEDREALKAEVRQAILQGLHPPARRH